jgi:hypothetical protein
MGDDMIVAVDKGNRNLGARGMWRELGHTTHTHTHTHGTASRLTGNPSIMIS